MSDPKDQPDRKKCRIRKILRIVLLVLFILTAATVYGALTPWAIRELWLPLAARSTGAVIRADDVRLESCFPLRMRVVNFYYADQETIVEIRSGVFRLRLRKLFQHSAVLKKTRLDGIRVVCRYRPEKKPSPKPDRPPAADRQQDQESPWSFSMEDFKLRNAVVEIENRERRTVQIWRADTLEGDWFQPGSPCKVKAAASVVILPDKHNPLNIRSLPFRLDAKYQLDAQYRLKEFQVWLRTGIMDLSVTDEIVVRPESQIRAIVRINAVCPAENIFQIRRSETRFLRGEEDIGLMHFIGSFGDTFECSGSFEQLNMEPYLSILVPDSKIRLTVPQAEFSASGSDFSPDALRSGLTARLTARMEDISIPIELNDQNMLARLIMIPIESLPSFFKMLGLRWNQDRKINACRESLESFLAGKRNLDFDRAKMDLSLSKGTLTVSDLELRGRLVEMESIRGRVQIESKELDISTIIVLAGLRVPLKFRGTLDDPETHYENAVQEFLELNAPFRKIIKSLDEPPSEQDSKLKKNLKRGYQQLNRLLNF